MKGLSKDRYDETFAGEDAEPSLITVVINTSRYGFATDCMLGSQPNHSWQLCFPL